jgi:V/A-type H+-transporting ATPase subunit A
LQKQYKLLKAILAYNEKSKKAIEQGADIELLSNIPVRETIGRLKSVPLEEFDQALKDVLSALDSQIDEVIARKED